MIKFYISFLLTASILVSCAPDPGNPPTPAAVNPFLLSIATAGSNTITFVWSETNGATGYVLSYSASSNGVFSQIYSGGALNFQQNGLTPDTTYYYRLSADMGGAMFDLPVIAMRTLPVRLQFGGITVDGFISNLTSAPMKKYSIYNNNIKITSTTASNFLADSYFIIKGTNYAVDYPQAAIAIESPDGSQTIWHYLDDRGYFEKMIFLRYGGGNYKITVLIGPHPDGYWYVGAVMYVTNARTNDFRYLMPSEIVQSLDPRIRALAFQLTGMISEISNKARAIHDYLVKSIYYDLDIYNGIYRPQDAVAVYERWNAVCAGYSAIYAALLRAIDIPAVYIHGKAGGSETINHAWNEVWWANTWHIVDVTWDDPLIGGHSDYPDGYNLRWNYFDISEGAFLADHQDWSSVDYCSFGITGEEME
ncbi:MAG: hypothetical protein A2Y33_10180 [Spirochaetes bacterium GWF1_51_8]|nr:MAG: hypothetical protein A2Y33_10180 [Spirochaetes bacterium GWF1_51_8]